MMDHTITGKPIAGISMDLDDKWAYMKAHGDPGWDDYPSYLEYFIPELLDLLADLDLTITFFIVGRDAGREQNQDLLASITAAGHDVANHSYAHDPFFSVFSDDRIRREVELTDAYIFAATGATPVGFRGPGFSWSKKLLHILCDRGYRYDATTLPTCLGPIARKYFLSKAELLPEQKNALKDLYGGLESAFLPVAPYRWRLTGGREILELPVTTMPGLKLPFHLTYLMYLSHFSPLLMRAYFSTTLALLKASGTRPSFLLHPLDLMGSDSVPELSYFPAMGIPTRVKKARFVSIIQQIKRHFHPVSLNRFAEAAADTKKWRQPS